MSTTRSLAVPALGSARSTFTPNARLDEAHLELERCHWPEAYAIFAALADAGDARAARIALLMHRHGTRLFGGVRFDADEPRRARWIELGAG